MLPSYAEFDQRRRDQRGQNDLEHDLDDALPPSRRFLQQCPHVASDLLDTVLHLFLFLRDECHARHQLIQICLAFLQHFDAARVAVRPLLDVRQVFDDALVPALTALLRVDVIEPELHLSL